MGFEVALFMVNVFLYYYTRKFFFRWKNETYERLVFYQIFFSFIDDLCLFSNEEFENKYNIYPDKFGLKKKNECTCKTLFLDLQTEVRDRRFTNKLFDKRDAFPFNINKMPYTY